MRYIRTKYGVYEYPDERFIKDNRVLMSNPYDSIKYMTCVEFTQADTIEELCDEIVAVLKIDLKGDRPYIVKSERPIEFVKKCNYVGFEKALIDYYGAIWTEKGLIYIAKINSEGELELL